MELSNQLKHTGVTLEPGEVRREIAVVGGIAIAITREPKPKLSRRESKALARQRFLARREAEKDWKRRQQGEAQQ